MNTKVIVAIVAGIVIIGGGVAYFAMNQDDDKSASQTSSSTSSKQSSKEEDSTTKGSLASIRNDGKAQTCTFTYSGENGNGSGTMYTDGKGRGLLTMDLVTEKGNTGQSNTLTTTVKVYSWTKTEAGSIGFVFDTSTLNTDSSSTSSTTSSNTQNASQKFDLDCKSWTVDEAKLTVPTDVTFSSLPSGQ